MTSVYPYIDRGIRNSIAYIVSNTLQHTISRFVDYSVRNNVRQSTLCSLPIYDGIGIIKLNI